MSKGPGQLTVVATPIGNLSDLSPRAREALASADLVAAEDTRHTGALLATLGISASLLSLHEHNEAGRVAELIARMRGGEHIALVSDAGTPLLSDPGYELVRCAAQAGIRVSAIPGASAITTALALAGAPTDRFCFEGFLPAQAGERRSRLAALAAEMRTLVFFEAPHRIAESLRDLADAFGSARRAVVARELTKLHETVYRGTLDELSSLAQSEPNLARGEITVVVHGAEQSADAVSEIQIKRTLEVLLKELPPGKAAALAAQLTGARRSDVYALAMRLRRDGE